MTEILSKDEMEALLSAISTGEPDEPEDLNAPAKMDRHHKIKIYDFKRPDKFSKDQIRTLQMIHETFARLTTTSLSGQLRKLIQVHVVSVDQLNYEEFIRSVPGPTTLCIIEMHPLKGSAVLEIDPTITFSIIDRLLGGEGSTTRMNRELTDIELAIIENSIVRILGNLREAWSNVLDLRPRLGGIESNPQFAQVVPPSDMVVLITLEVKVGDVEGLMHFCIPYITIEPIIFKLSAQYWYSSIRKGETMEHYQVLKDRISQMNVDLVAEIGSVEVSMREVLAMQEGDVIKLRSTKLIDPIVLKVGDEDKFLCRPGVKGNRMGVKIEHPIENLAAKFYQDFQTDDESE